MNLKTYLLTSTIALTTVLVLSISGTSHAQEPETTGAGENATDSATTDELRRRIERVVEERREQIKGVVEDLLVKKGAYIGEVTRISEEAITVKSNETTNIIPLTEELVILQGNSPTTIDSIEVGNWATVLGNRSSTSIEAEYVLISENTLRPDNQLVSLGTIQTINRSELIIVPRGSEEELTISIQRDTIFEDETGEEITQAEFEEELSVLVTAVEGPDGWELKTVRSLAPLAVEDTEE